MLLVNLGSLETPSAIDPLIAAMKDPEANVANEAAWALGWKWPADPRVAGAMRTALRERAIAKLPNVYRFFIASSAKSMGVFGSNRRPNMLRSPCYQIVSAVSRGAAAVHFFRVGLSRPGSLSRR